MMIRNFKSLVCVILIYAVSNTLNADTIQIVTSAVANGSIDGRSFANTMVTITGVGDTDNVVVAGSSNLLLNELEVSVEIDGFASAIFTDAIQAVSNNNSELGGFGNTSTEFGLLLIFNDAFSDYDLLSNLDPVFGFGVIVIGVPHQTTAGDLRLFDIVGPATYAATVSKACPTQLGDINQDGNIDLLDVAPFVDALASGEFVCYADVNKDGNVNLLDVDAFISLLTGS